MNERVYLFAGTTKQDAERQQQAENARKEAEIMLGVVLHELLLLRALESVELRGWSYSNTVETFVDFKVKRVGVFIMCNWFGVTPADLGIF